ncbi:MAG: hypothetical protein DRO39_08390 [Thermoprotei archaeon]|nr:MAG: hypothetical protein DRO39_08390 [Thermoprotei archaeon]
METGLRGEYLVIAAAVLWGTMGVAGRLAYSAGMEPAQLMVWRALLLLPLSLPILLKCRYRGIATLFGLGVVAPFYLGYFYAVKLVGASTAALLLYTAPVYVALLSPKLLGEPLDRAALAALLLAVLGTSAISWGELRMEPLGLFMAMGTALLYAAYIITTRALARKGVEPQCIGIAPVAAALPVFALVAVLEGELTIPSLRGIAIATYIAYGPTALAYYLYARGVRRTTALRAGVAALVEPVSAYVLAISLLGEASPPLKTAGAVAIILAALLVTLSPEKRALISRREP